MADFLEERLLETVRYGASWQDDYAVRESRTSGGSEYPALIHPFPVREFDVSYLLSRADLFAYLLDLYHRAHGTFGAFRVRCYDEWSSNGTVGTPTAFDQPMGLVSAGVYELRKYYGTALAAGATGYPHRKIKKPVAGTVKFAIGGLSANPPRYTVDHTTGRVTLTAGTGGTISAITKAASATLSFSAIAGVRLTAGDTIHISGVAGMTQINGLRGLVTATDSLGTAWATVNINSTAFSTYTSGGGIQTAPASGESVTAGFEFDFPAGFVEPLQVGMDYPNHRTIESVRLRERLNP